MKLNRFVVLCIGFSLMMPALSQARVDISDENTELGETFTAEILADRAQQTPKECDDVGLDDAQKASLKQASWDFMKQKNTLGAAAKNAWMDYAFTLASSASTRDQGTAAFGAARDATVALGNAKGDFEIKIFYDILRPEQRENAMKCIMKMMKQKMQDELKKKCAAMPKK